MIRVSLSDLEKSIVWILLWHRRASIALHEHLLLEASLPPTSKAVFFGMTSQQVEEFFAELDYLCILDLLSATEAALRVDFWTRVQNKKRDRLSRHFRNLNRTKGRKISLNSHILESWIEYDPGLKSKVAHFRGTLKLRDWLAHGRYWTPRFGRVDYSPTDVFDVCNSLLGKCKITPRK
jgi:hypothetical protein